MSNKESSWDSFWHESDTVTERDVYSIINEAKFNHLKGLIPSQGVSLEVGAGTAHLSANLAAHGYETTCLDYSEEAIKAAKKNYEHQGLSGKFVQGDAFHLPFQEGQFDLTLSTGLLEHYDNPLPIMLEMVRVLKPGGVFYSDIVPERFSLLRAFQRFRRPLESMDDFYERAFTQVEIEAMLTETKLRDIKVYPAGVYPPELPLFHRSAMYRRFERSFLDRTAGFWTRFDNTKVAQWLGFYYFSYGIK
ncbi:MAG TPA: class I SAM-dependent methyltransferase [Actinobacteria bacterium]|nr:class I SAM-dependent methyltransferase [Actinomycetota bacterium]